MTLPLAYNSNQHPAESTAEVIAALDSFTTPLRQRLGWQDVGLDLRFSSTMLAEFRDDPAVGDALRTALDRAGALAYTINAFPLTHFQGEVVKDRAYWPDWTHDLRRNDSLTAIELACRLSDEPLVTISTVPGSFKPWGPQANDTAVIAAAWGRWAAAAARHQQTTGRTVVLCPEPEPLCTIETSTETIALWKDALAIHGLNAAKRDLDGDEQAARDALSTHLALCYDTCHLSVEFEDQATAVEQLVGAGIHPTKLQFSACPRIEGGAANAEGLASLRSMHEPRFLHQTALRSGDGPVTMVQDLDQLDAGLAGCPDADDIRSHFHIPIYTDPTAPGISSTVDDSLRGLAACIKHGTRHIAVETYTWSILAESDQDALEGTARELEWLSDRLKAIPSVER